MASDSVIISADAAIIYFKSAILSNLTQEQKDKILAQAVGNILQLGTGYGNDRFDRDIMSQAVASACKEIVQEKLREPESQAKLKAALDKAFDKLWTKVLDQTTNGFLAAVEKGLERW